MANEIILYQPNETVKLEVRLENERVWLTQAQIVELFKSSKANISEHIKNIFCIGELDASATVRKFRTVRKEGARKVSREIEYYNLDLIISVGFRVNTRQGILFRQWATKILKEYAVRGCAVSQRFERIESRVAEIERWRSDVDMVVQTTLPPREGLFFAGQVYDAFEFVRKIITSAKSEIVLIDNYVDESVLTMLSDKSATVSAKIFTRKVPQPLALAARKFNEQYGTLTLTPFTLSHDRFLIIDRKKLYLIGASLKDLGKKWFGVTEMDSANIPRILAELNLV